MEKLLKHLSLFALIFAAAFALNTATASAAKVRAYIATNTDTSHWEASSDKRLKFKAAGLPKGKEYILKMPTSCHYVFTLNGQKYIVVGGSYYVNKQGFLTPVSRDKHLALDYYTVANNFKAKKNGIAARTVLSTPPRTNVEVNGHTFKYGKGTVLNKCRNTNTSSDSFLKGSILYVPVAGPRFTGLSDNKLICKNGEAYSGYTLKNKKMYKVTNGKVGAAFTGTTNSYFSYEGKKFKTTTVKTYKNGKLANGWVTSGSGKYGIYKKGVLNKSKNYWMENPANGKWYYLQSGKIYRTGKKGVSKKKLKTKGLDYWGHGDASPGAYRYYLNKDGSLVTDVFKADKSWYGKKMRIYINAKAGIDNVTFMGYVKGGGFCVPLKTVVTTCSKTSDVLRKQVRGRKGSGKWKLGRTGKSRQRWFLFHKNGNTYYYQYATSIIGSGALFHSPRFLRHNIRSLYKPHFNAMGKKNITTKCVRLQVANAFMVYNISKKCNSYNFVTFVRQKRNKKTAYLPFGITELSDSTGKKYWKKNYDPSDPGIK